MKINQLTPVMLVDAIEPVLPFWERLGFERTAEVPEGDRLGFVILARDGIQIMYQTAQSVRADVPALGDLPLNGTSLFLVVDDLDAFVEIVDVEPVVPRRTTFYGADELIVRDPAGNVITFAEFKES
jgi:hypothetical protein